MGRDVEGSEQDIVRSMALIFYMDIILEHDYIVHRQSRAKGNLPQHRKKTLDGREMVAKQYIFVDFSNLSLQCS